MAEPHKGIAFEYGVFLTDFQDPSKFNPAPVIAAGDVQISKDFGDYTNLGTVPTVIDEGRVKVTLSALEMTADNVSVLFRDQAGDSWKDQEREFSLGEGTAETVLQLMKADWTVDENRSIARVEGTPTIILDKDVSGSGMGPNRTVRTTKHL